MQQSPHHSVRVPAILALSLTLLIVLFAAAYGWLQHGSAILLAAGEAGLSWCF
jgi:hypothetical protein